MDSRIDSDKERLAQESQAKSFFKDNRPGDLVTFFTSIDSDDSSFGIYSGLVPYRYLEKCLESTSWDITEGDGRPDVGEFMEDGKEKIEYYRFGSKEEFEPLVHRRSFHGIREPYFEINEEFRFFHDLYHDKDKNKFFKFDDAGNETLIAEIDEESVRIRLLEVRQYASIKEKSLFFYIDSREFSAFSLAELGKEEGGDEVKLQNGIYGLHWGEPGLIRPRKALSRFLGKKFLPALPKEKSGVWAFEEEDEDPTVEFVMGVTEDGKPIETGPFLQAGGEGDLIPIFFRKSVLDKYYQKSQMYSVETGYIRCGGLWGIPIDNHQDGVVVAWLRDLRRIPYSEQLHWKAHNVDSGSVSDTFFRQQILSQWVDSENPEHVFRAEYEKLAEKSWSVLGWKILKPLSKHDEHFFKTIRIPSADEQSQFDSIILSLTKTSIDSLNESEISRRYPEEVHKGADGKSLPGITKLANLFKLKGLVDYDKQISFLRELQEIRSKSVAHRKGEGYEKLVAELGIKRGGIAKFIEGLIGKNIEFFRFLYDNIEKLV